MASNNELPTTTKKLKSNVNSQENLDIEDPFEVPCIIKKNISPLKMSDSKNIVDNDQNLFKKVSFFFSGVRYANFKNEFA